jgi:hypothetical protein
MSLLFKFLVSPSGRLTRVVAGLLLLAAGYLLGDVAGVVVALVGLVPLAAGLVDVCVFAPPFGYPFVGQSVRAALYADR